jgi:hypothetical protein
MRLSLDKLEFQNKRKEKKLKYKQFSGAKSRLTILGKNIK